MKDPRAFRIGAILLLAVFVEVFAPAAVGWSMHDSVWAAPWALVLLVTTIAAASLVYRGRYGDDEP